MMKSGPLLLAASWLLPSSTTFTALSSRPRVGRLFSGASSSSDVTAAALRSGISRLSTLQTLLKKFGAPGSECTEANDLSPVIAFEDTPELVGCLIGNDAELMNLHPHLFPISKSEKTGNYICALRRAYADDASYESSTDSPWPIVEARSGGPGMRLLALSSEHLMRRIACQSDFAGFEKDIIAIYNDGLGRGLVNDKELDVVYEPGSPELLGYGVDKYILLRVAPFPDLYERMATQHAARGDEQSALIAAEACNRKLSGFGSTFKFQAKLLSSFPKREEEARDVARMCLRMPLPSIGMTQEVFHEVAVLAQLADENDSNDEAMAKLRDMYEKIRQHGQEENPAVQQGMTPEQAAFEEANYLLDTVALTGGKWSDIRMQLGEIYRSVGREDMSDFVNPKVL